MLYLARTAVLSVVVGGLAFIVGGSGAEAGGGCHRAGVDGSLRDQQGNAVKHDDSSFTPTVIHVAQGDTVTWTNTEDVVHDILGEDWGQQRLVKGSTLTRRFDNAGVYPYTCNLHPFMVGAVVVEGGGSTGSLLRTTAGPGAGAAPQADAASQADAGGTGVATGANDAPWYVLGAIGVTAVAAVSAASAVVAVRERASRR